LCDYCFIFFLSDLADQIKKNSAPLPNTKRGAAGLISRFIEYIRVARLLALGAHFLSIVVVHRIVLSVAYRLIPFIECCTVSVIAYRFAFLIESSLRFAYRSASINKLLRSSHIVSIYNFGRALSGFGDPEGYPVVATYTAMIKMLSS